MLSNFPYIINACKSPAFYFEESNKWFSSFWPLNLGTDRSVCLPGAAAFPALFYDNHLQTLHCFTTLWLYVTALHVTFESRSLSKWGQSSCWWILLMIQVNTWEQREPHRNSMVLMNPSGHHLTNPYTVHKYTHTLYTACNNNSNKLTW